ncbi:MAG: dTDP-glucose 4,6-dehydratase [Candidatus Peribacteraceae bacterium]
MSHQLLVTGGAGFIGSHFVLRHVVSAPADAVVVLDKLTYAADRKFLEPVAQAITFVQGDIADTALVGKLVEEHRIDTIVNFAAETHVDRSIDDPFPFLHTNVLGVQSLIEVCRKSKALRLLHISTDEVYGDLDDREPPKKTADALWPSSPYAASKAAGDLLVIAAMRTYGIHATISRCTNNYGPHQALEKFIPTVIRTALLSQPVPIYAEGKNKRDWLFVTDHTDAIEVILETDWAFFDSEIGSGHIFNVSADDERQNIDVATKVLDILGKPKSLLTSVKDRPGHDWRYALDSSAIRKLGWAPKIGFEEGLKRTVEWYCRRLG